MSNDRADDTDTRIRDLLRKSGWPEPERISERPISPSDIENITQAEKTAWRQSWQEMGAVTRVAPRTSGDQ